MKSLFFAILITFTSLTGRSYAADAILKPYPLSTCIISGEILGLMGTPAVFTYEDQEVKFCCKQCKKAFDKDQAKFIKKIQEAK